jgi:hypothetical protein
MHEIGCNIRAFVVKFEDGSFNIVRSFSFVGDPVYWTDDEEEKGRANGHVQARRVVKVNRN